MRPYPQRLRAAVVLAVAYTACGYHVAGRGDRLPPDVKTIAVPIFTNQSKQFRIEQILSGAVTRELIERTHFRVTADPAAADAVLQATIKDVSSGVITFDLNTGRATALQVVVTTSVSLVDCHTQKVLFSNTGYVFREEYQINQSTSQLFEEEGPALRRLAEDFAHTLVTDILENF
jgi:outer membrane lipopolysaccharide assembly protein LptE/RlpB